MSATLRAEHLIKKYKARTVVNDVSLEVKQGEIVGLLGPNGAGKTTTFYMMTGLAKPNRGKIFFKDQDITSKPMHIRARLGIGYLPQEASVFRKLTVKQNVMAILELRGNLSKTERLSKMDELLKEFHIDHLGDITGISLSGGERRRLEIARALAMDPDFILLDEPFAGIDPISIIDIKNIIEHLAQRGIGVLITDHNVRETLTICQHAYIMNAGKIIAAGHPDQILQDQQVKSVYLGEDFKL